MHDHAFCHIFSGSHVFYKSGNKVVFNEGDSYFVKRNQLLRVNKYPGTNGDCKAISVIFDQKTLRDFSMQNHILAEKNHSEEELTLLNRNVLYNDFAASLLPYETDGESVSKLLTTLKVQEAILLMLHLDTKLKSLLFDFSEPGKIDLEEFMNKHFEFNVEIKRFAYLTGRSLATFKRDFEKIFNTSPSRWLMHKRLSQAYYLIKEKNRKPSDVYLEVGFEDLSHFSFAFKKAFGAAPTLI
ncbi:hypothetical protein Dfri01_08930 [Dyadobacter frigoris]|nr:hypothetical protein Dfri01_08930 [Dyadobacter frigoris]